MPEIVQSDGFSWIMREGTEDHLGPSSHEAVLWPFFDSLCPQDGVFVDVGAHVGHYTVRLAGRCSKVYAVEAEPLTAEGLRTNLELNHIHNVEVLEVVASDHLGHVAMQNPHETQAGGSTRIVEGLLGFAQCDRLDDLIEPDRIDLLKIDVEGHEGHVLAGAHDLLMNYRPVILLEMHHKMYGDQIREDVLNQFDVLGYEYSVVHQNIDVENWVCFPTETPEFADT